MDRLPLTAGIRWWFPLATVVLFGCTGSGTSDYSRMELVEVSGTVKLDGAPVEGVTVIFEDADRNSSQGTTNAAGRYQLRYTSEQSGVSPGKKTVRILFGGGEGSDGEDEVEDESGTVKKREQKIPERYNSQSELTREVKSGVQGQTFDFDLTSK